MKHIKLFENFNIHAIDDWCNLYKITNYTINADGSIDVDGDVRINHKAITHLPIKFNYISGSLDLFDCKLITLYGCPKEIGGYFDCSHNQLKYLEFAPQKIHGDFDCSYNQLLSLEHSPKTVLDYNCYNNYITSLEFTPEIVNGDFKCYGNKNLETLSGLVSQINGHFSGDPRLNVIYNILGGETENITDFYNFNIINDNNDESSYKMSINIKRLKRFLELYDLEELSDGNLNKLKIYYNVI